MKIPFLGGAYEGRSKSLNAQQSINLFPVYDQNEGKEVIAMYGTPGLKAFCSTHAAIVRRLHVMGDYMYAVVGNTVYEITSAGVATSLGTITTSTGHISMADNGTQLLIVDGTTSGYIVTTGVMNVIADTDFIAATTCVFFDGFFIVSESGTGRIWISASYDGTSWDALDFATAEAVPDELVGIGTTRQNLWLFGGLSTEVYANVGDPDFPFQRVPGATLYIGCGSIGSIVEIDGSIYWMTNKRTIVRNNGYQYELISPPAINYQISTYDTINDATAFTYTLEGRRFYVINFPTEKKTWVMDIDSGQWHEWQSLG
jgi:hypothetical protein